MRMGRAIINNEAFAVVEYEGAWYGMGRGERTVPMVKDNIPFEKIRGRLGTNCLLREAPENFELTHTPRQIICVGRNYAAHAKELGNEIPTSPLLFNKLPSTCIPHGAAIEFPQSLGRVDYEGEIGVVIGKESRNLSKEDAYDHILGYTLLNDVTARDQQSRAKEKRHPWLMAKNHATFCPFGPTITYKESIPWPLEIDLTLEVNGETRQSGNTRDFIFDIPTLIKHITAQFTLYPGDIIATGTPEGVAPVHHNDTLELTAPGLGTLQNPVLTKP